jgi:hypothetical protein
MGIVAFAVQMAEDATGAFNFAASSHLRWLIAVSVNKAFSLPNLKTSADARHVYPMGVFDSGRVLVTVGVDRVVDVVAVIDEMNTVTRHGLAG